MVLKKRAMTELRTHLPFTQLRFHCSKQQGRMFHVTTAANSTGEAAVQYFSGQTDVQPASCGSFVTMKDDNSHLAVKCGQWGYDSWPRVGKWGHSEYPGVRRIYNYPAFVIDMYQWRILTEEMLCDDSINDFIGLSPGDFWKIYAR